MTELIGIQGFPGAFTESAALQMHGDDASIVYIPTFEDLFRELRDKNIGTAVTAIANVNVGFIPEPHEELHAHGADAYWITGEAYVEVAHQLLGVPGATLDQITAVHSMAPALQQCTHNLHSLLPGIPAIEEDDTAYSAQLVSRLADPSQAAIASARAGEINGLEVIKADMQDAKTNITRFLSIKGRQEGIDAMDGTENKTTVLMEMPDSEGSLYKALGPFHDGEISIATLQSSYIKDTRFRAQFYMEFDAGINDEATKAALEWLAKHGYSIRVLGSYRQALIPYGEDQETRD